MTSGEIIGTSGVARLSIGPWGALWAVGAVVALVNATSVLIEWDRVGYVDREPFEPFLWEISSAIAVLALAPLLGPAIARWPVTLDKLWPNAAIHAALTIPFCLAHVAAMVAIRYLVYLTLGLRYDYFVGGTATVLFYEWRKDVLTYALIAGVYWLFARLRAARAEPTPAKGDERIAVRDGSQTIYLKPADILWIEAAGNYVEIHSESGMRLVRGTLAAWEERLGRLGFARVHRSRLVNRAHIGAILPTPAGDFTVKLDSGVTLAGSRRYRDGLLNV